MEFPHLRNNYPYLVELKVTSNDDSYGTITKDITVGGILRQPYIHVEIPMNSN